MKIIQEIKDRISSGEIFNVVIINNNNDCSVNMGFGYIPKSVLFEVCDDFGCVVEDDMLSIKQAINIVNDSDEDFYEIRIEEIETASISGATEIYA